MNWFYQFLDFASGCLGGLLSVDNICFDRMVGRVCPVGLLLDGTCFSDAGAPFLDLGPCGSCGAVSAKVCSGRDDFGFGVVGSLFWMVVSPGVPRVWCAYLGLLDSPGLLQVLVALAAVVKPFCQTSWAGLSLF